MFIFKGEQREVAMEPVEKTMIRRMFNFSETKPMKSCYR
jgi:hypothetical protein